ncbi:Uncharacterized protein BP5553_09848 [Venustampulla echinocandica]|uniref:Uncharacterized protein n=1 Tax=Venustampulla echinocandica TaxID=2656787 RepID=A0A370TAV6_9HELO|nr:Uncharacterized protein BP5553_09848 [Venustampulla echinocandica]RDL31059.1 Uncharacterized protein BP5553_09848 [Venustampulla echinocandica]
MSITTSTNTATTNRLEVLADYNLHHSEGQSLSEQSTVSHPPYADALHQNNPDWWPTDHRRVPDYRPINRNLDRIQRPDGTNMIEMAFIFTMLRGVQLNASVSYLWRYTGAYLNGGLFRYDIGGEK